MAVLDLRHPRPQQPPPPAGNVPAYMFEPLQGQDGVSYIPLDQARRALGVPVSSTEVNHLRPAIRIKPTKLPSGAKGYEIIATLVVTPSEGGLIDKPSDEDRPIYATKRQSVRFIVEGVTTPFYEGYIRDGRVTELAPKSWDGVVNHVYIFEHDNQLNVITGNYP